MPVGKLLAKIDSAELSEWRELWRISDWQTQPDFPRPREITTVDQDRLRAQILATLPPGVIRGIPQTP